MDETEREEVGRRVAAARKRAGLKRRSDLAKKLTLPRMGKETIGKIERGERELYEHEAPDFAAALEVTVAYFYETSAETQLDRIESILRANSELMAGIASQLVALGAPAVETHEQDEDEDQSGPS
jgi:transcriptional regulator with XRE-family HTH domain